MDHTRLHPPGVALYVHVPFCTSRCRYCNFVSTTGAEDLMPRYLDAVLGEVDHVLEQLHVDRSTDRHVKTLYLGGGTPTALPRTLLTKLIDGLLVRVECVDELTVECNPATVDDELLHALAEVGSVRLSVGAQSFEDRLLKMLGRGHTAGDIDRTVRRARRAGVRSIGLDLMYALPGQSVQEFTRSVDRALGLGVDAVSIYALSYEPGTPMHHEVQRGTLHPVDEGLDRRMVDTAVHLLRRGGLPPYELSNHARPGHACLHNLHVWQGGWYAGVGVAASSFVFGEHITNTDDLVHYIECMESGRSPVARRLRPTPAERAGELAVLSLRTTEGLNLERFARQCSVGARELFGDSIRRHTAVGMLMDLGDRLVLTEAARPVADGILVDFSLPDRPSAFSGTAAPGGVSIG